MVSTPKPAASLESMLGAQHGDQPAELIRRYLTEAREQLRMDVAYVAEFREGLRVYRFVDGDELPESIRVGTGEPRQDTYAQRVLDGRVTGVVADVARDPELRELKETSESGIASFVGVPLRLANGRVYGTMCAFSRNPSPGLDDRAAGFLEAFARLIGDQLEHQEGEWDDLRLQIERVEQVLESGVLTMVFQPIFNLRTRQVIGVEGLARFPVEPHRSPDAWFSEAWTVGRGVDLELAAVRAALGQVIYLPAGAFLSVNVSAETVISPRLEEGLSGMPCERIVLEVPERAPVEDHYALNEAIARLQGLGVRIAADDAGAGFDSLSHILELGPDIIKFDVALTRDVDTDPVRRSLAASLVEFAQQFDAMVIAEGIETEAEMNALKDLGFGFGQGYHLARPGPLPLEPNPVNDPR